MISISVLVNNYPANLLAQTEKPPTTTPAPVTAPPAPVTPPATTVAENTDFISLDFKDADINTVLRVMSMKSNINIVAGPEVKGTVTIRLENVPWQKALDVVLRTYDYVYEKEGNIIRVTTREKMSQEPAVTQTFVLNYTKAQEILEAVKDMLTERGRIKTADRTNALVITDIPTNLYRIGNIIKDLDKVTPQAYIDSKIIKTDIGSSDTWGIQWNAQASLKGASRPTTFPFPTGGVNNDLSPVVNQFLPVLAPTTTSTRNENIRDYPMLGVPSASGNPFQFGSLDFSSFTALLKMLQNQSNVKVQSNPRIVVLNNQKAKVQVGNQIPIPAYERNSQTGRMEVTGYSFRDIGVVLNVTPHINSESEILVELEPEVSSQLANQDYGDFEAPAFAITTAKTQVLIESGQTIAIGGLMTDAVDVSETKVPYLSDVPLFGKLFRSKTQEAGDRNKKVETLFFVTVTSVDTQGQPLSDRTKTQTQNGAAPTTSDASSDEQDKSEEKKVQAQEGSSQSTTDAKTQTTAPKPELAKEQT